MNRTVLRQLAEDRLLDVQTLLNSGRWSGAYYLAGYALECGLKACILARVEWTGEIFIEKKFSEKCFTHNLTELVISAGLQRAHGIELDANPSFKGFWNEAVEWKEDSRYKQRTEVEARGLFDAITYVPDGVLRWIRLYW